MRLKRRSTRSLGSEGRKRIFPDAKRRTSNEKHGRHPLTAFVTGPRAADFVAARQRLKTGEGKFAPDAALNGRAKNGSTKGAAALL